jgi:hypothetical protein
MTLGQQSAKFSLIFLESEYLGDLNAVQHGRQRECQREEDFAMHSRRRIDIGFLIAFGLELSCGCALAATPDFTVSAANTIMPSSGFGAIPVTLTSINGYVGSVTTNCNPTNPPIGAKLPICGGPTAPPIYALTANQTVTGSISLMPYGDRLPLPASTQHSDGRRLAQGLALAGALLFGLRTRLQVWRRLALTFFVLFVLVGLTGISACVGNGNSNGMTPGIYQYTVTAGDNNTGEFVTTNVLVTVP